MTMAIKFEQQKVVVEFPIDQEKQFMILNFFLLNENGQRFFIRKVFEIYKDKKLKVLFSQHLEFLNSPNKTEEDQFRLYY
mmetsp:Transcript_19981/g.18971  ORF Transcript_19981/g.18971 Transcript_19981/m.18971 type:complete len:80 (-) Transcript_19981:247-486(-)